MKTKLIVNGYQCSENYGHLFVKIFFQNVGNGEVNLFFFFFEANYSLMKNKFSVLKYINDDFRIKGNNTFEYILFYEEYNTTMHWSQITNPYESVSNTGYVPIHIEKDGIYFEGLSFSNWWYCIGLKKTYSDGSKSGIPGPFYLGTIIVSKVSLWIRIDDIRLIERFPQLKVFCTLKYIKKKGFDIISTIFLISC